MRCEAGMFFCMHMLVLFGPIEASDTSLPSKMVKLSIDVGDGTRTVQVSETATVFEVKAALHRQRCFEEFDPYRRSDTPPNAKKAFEEYGQDTQQIRINLFTVTRSMCGLLYQRSEQPLQDHQKMIDIIEQEGTRNLAARLDLLPTKDIFTAVSRYRNLLEQESKKGKEEKHELSKNMCTVGHGDGFPCSSNSTGKAAGSKE